MTKMARHEKGAHMERPNKMAERTGLEPATHGVTGRYSNQLNYRSARCNFLVGADGFEPPTYAL